MRFLFSLLSLGAVCYGVWHFSETKPELKIKVEELLHAGSFHTLEIRYSANHVMEANRKTLLKDNRHRYLESTMKFYPYVLMEVKYALSDKKTKEGVVLWDLNDGEMVLETKHWKKTHGFGDCILAGTDRHEFKVIHALASKGGATDRKTLASLLRVESEILDSWIESCRRKKLVVQSGNRYRLHLEKPYFQKLPITKIEERLVTKSHRNAERAQSRYSLSQIEKLAKAAFGADFVIRKTMDLYLPIHCIAVQNPDGSIHTSHWNALNGEQIGSSTNQVLP